MIDNPENRGEWTSASNAQADSLCPGRHLAQRGIKEDTNNAAEFGLKVHYASAGEPVDLNLTQEKVLSLARQRREKVLGRFPGNRFEIYHERRLWVEYHTWKHSGQADALYVDFKAKLAITEDLKSLRGAVPESPENMQLRDLAVLAWQNFNLDEVVVFINQPLAGEQQKITRYEAPSLAQAWSYMKLRIAQSNDPASPRIPGVVQCQYCRARGVCKEALEWAKAGTVDLIRKESVQELVARISPEQLADVWEKSKTITAILDAVKIRLLEMPDEELEKLCIRRKDGEFRETIMDNHELMKRLKSYKITNKMALAYMKFTKRGLENLLRKKTRMTGEELAAAMKNLTSGIVDRKQTSATLEKMK